jgi:predicted ATPase/DNA-binding SARP family transcriptional activator
MPICTAHFFGFPLIAVEGRPVKIERRKSMALLVYLLSETGSAGASRAFLANMLWPGMEPAEADWSLSNAIGDLSEALGDTIIVSDGGLLLVGQSFQVDVWAFEKLAEVKDGVLETKGTSGESLSEAAALYRGDFLTGFNLSDAPAFDRWQTEVADRLRSTLLLVLEQLGGWYARTGQLDAAVAAARRWISLNPLYEPAHHALMGYLATMRQQAAALRVYEDFARLLTEEMELEPSPAMQAEYRALLGGHHGSSGVPEIGTPAALAADVAPSTGLQVDQLRSMPVDPTRKLQDGLAVPGVDRLPDPVTQFIGRELELASLAGLLRNPAARMITLLGPGGSGKTRLAIQAARLQAESGTVIELFPDGIFFIPLAAYQRVDDVLPAIAGALACPLPVGLSVVDGQVRLAHFLAGRRCLLVLDNLEHLMPAVTWVADLLSAAPGVKLLLTTRQRFNMPVEYVLEVEGMPVPGLRERTNPEKCSSVQLFLACAARTRVGFTPEPADWPAISHICQLVEGLPLGIELAAAWVRMFTPAQIAEAIERSPDFLSGDAGPQPEQQHSLRAVFEYSWRLLNERERSVFRKLAIFAGDFSPAAAAQVAGAPLPLLADLLDRSLLRRSASGPGRYELHEILKQYAREKLMEEPFEEADAQDFHRAYYLGLLIDQFEAMKGPRQAAALRELELEGDNIDQAWQRALAERRYLDLQRASLPLIFFYEAGPRRGQALAVFQSAHECVAALRPGEFDSPARRALLALLTAAHKRFMFGQVKDDALNQQLHQAAVDCANRLPDSLDKALTLLLTNAGPTGMDPHQIVQQLDEAIRIFSAYGYDWGEAMARLVLGDNAVYHLKDLDLAFRSYRRSLEAFNRLGHDWGRALCLSGMGHAALAQGDLLEAVRLWGESVDLYQKTNDVWREVDFRGSISAVLARLGRNEEAMALLEQNVRVLEGLGASTTLGWTLGNMALLSLQVQSSAQAVEAEQHKHQHPEPQHQQVAAQTAAHSQHYFLHALEVFQNLGDLDSITRLHEQAAAFPQVAGWSRASYSA